MVMSFKMICIINYDSLLGKKIICLIIMNLRKPGIRKEIWHATENFSSDFLEYLKNNTSNIYSTT